VSDVYERELRHFKAMGAKARGRFIVSVTDMHESDFEEGDVKLSLHVERKTLAGAVRLFVLARAFYRTAGRDRYLVQLLVHNWSLKRKKAVSVSGGTK
jgi:hypothetical protein